MGGFSTMWQQDPSFNPTWYGGYPSSGSNLVGGGGMQGLSPDFWNFPGGQWGPAGFEIPWYALGAIGLPTDTNDPWWGQVDWKSIMAGIMGMPWDPAEGTGEAVEAPGLPPGAEEQPEQGTGEGGEATSPLPGSGTVEDPWRVERVSRMPIDPALPIAAGLGGIIPVIGGAGAGAGGTGNAVLPEGDPLYFIEHAEELVRGDTKPGGGDGRVLPVWTAQGIDWLPTEPTPMPPMEIPDLPPETPVPPVVVDPITTPPPNIPTVPSPMPVDLIPDSGTGGTGWKPNLPQLPDMGDAGAGGGAPFAAPPDARAGAAKTLQSLLQLPAGVVQQVPSLGALIANLRR